jgi:hypothetical protein
MQPKTLAWAIAVALAVVAYSAATLSGSYPGLLLGIGLIASTVLYSTYLKATGSLRKLRSLAWFSTLTFGAATLIAFIDYEIRNTQMGMIVTYLMFITAAALVIAVGLSVAARLRSS